MDRIDYELIVKEYSDEAFHDCVHQLYPLFEYRYLKEKDVRKVDLIEKLLMLENRYSKSSIAFRLPLVKEKSPAAILASQIDFFADNYFRRKGLIGAYYNKAERLVDRIENGSGDLEDLEDLIKIFISVMRGYELQWQDPKADFAPFAFEVRREDAGMLKAFLDHSFAEIGPYTPGPARMNPVKVTKPHEFNINVYFNSVVIYCRIMQYEGKYSEEGDFNGNGKN